VGKLSIIKVCRSDLYLKAENDIHYAALTVKQTLEFALKTRTPKQRPAEMSKKQYRRTFLHALLTIFGIEHTLETRVGNEVIDVEILIIYVAHSRHIWR